MKQTIYVLFVFLLGFLLLAENAGASICDRKETVVYFGNGIKNLETDANKSKDILRRRLQAVQPPEEFELLDFKLSYNPTGGAIRDLFESTIQSLTLDASRFWRILWGHEFMPDWFAEKLLILATAFDKSSLVTSDSLGNHVSAYTAKIAEGKKVLLVAHSQGVFFGNLAYNLLDGDQRLSFGMVAVANPDSSVLDDSSAEAPYTTLENDKVIQAIITARILLPPQPMEPNTANLELSADSLQHSFTTAYMAEGTISNTQVVDDILAALASVVTPRQVVDSGIINVMLTWGSAPDVDLHVYEPNGSHVFWYNMDGISGELDVDDTSKWGPEHYRVLTCDMLEEGFYRIGLDYYLGDLPEVAVLQVDAGLISRTFEIVMPSDLYGTPLSPRLVATIYAHRTADNGFEFSVYQ